MHIYKCICMHTYIDTKKESAHPFTDIRIDMPMQIHIYINTSVRGHLRTGWHIQNSQFKETGRIKYMQLPTSTMFGKISTENDATLQVSSSSSGDESVLMCHEAHPPKSSQVNPKTSFWLHAGTSASGSWLGTGLLLAREILHHLRFLLGFLWNTVNFMGLSKEV